MPVPWLTRSLLVVLLIQLHESYRESIFLITSGVRVDEADEAMDDADLTLEAPNRLFDFGFLEDAASKEAFDSKWHVMVQDFMKTLEALEPTSLLGFTSSSNATKSPAAGDSSVLFVLQSGAVYYDTRLSWISQTWASSLNADSLVVIGDKSANDALKMQVQTTKCPSSHGEGGCCKMAEVIITAYSMMQKNPSLQWMFYADDDAYVRTDAVQKKLAKKNPNGTHGKGAVYAIEGCATKKCGSGICGGGGFAASRLAIQSLVQHDGAANLLRQQMHTCNVCEEWADISVAKLMEHHNVTLRPLKGLYAWQLNKTAFDKTLDGENAEPLMFHYIKTKGQMNFLQALFHGGRWGTFHSLHESADSGKSAKDCATFRGSTVCLTSASKARGAAPWS